MGRLQLEHQLDFILGNADGGGDLIGPLAALVEAEDLHPAVEIDGLAWRGGGGSLVEGGLLDGGVEALLEALYLEAQQLQGLLHFLFGVIPAGGLAVDLGFEEDEQTDAKAESEGEDEVGDDLEQRGADGVEGLHGDDPSEEYVSAHCGLRSG